MTDCILIITRSESFCKAKCEGVLYPSLRVGEKRKKRKKKAEEASCGKVEYSNYLPHKESTAS
jgi:hypothetical protein